MKASRRILMTAVLPFALLAGCATTRGWEEASPIETAPLSLKLGYDVSFLRVDVRRATHFETEMITAPATQSASSGSGGTTSSGGAASSGSGPTTELEEVPVENPYHYLVVDLGNGLILDEAGNLSVDLLRLYHLDGARDFKVTKRYNAFLPAGFEVTKKGNSLDRRGIGLSGGRVSATQEGSVVRLVGDIFHRHMRIIVKPGSISYEPTGRKGINTVTLEQPSADEVVLPDSAGNRIIALHGPNHLSGSNGLEIFREPKQLRILFHGASGVEASYRYTKTKDGCVISQDNAYHTIAVERSGNVIRVYDNGGLTSTITVDSLTP